MNTTALNPVLTTYQAPYRAPLLASLMLILTLLQGSSATLTLAFRPPFDSNLLKTQVSVLWLAMYLTATAGLIATQGINWLTWVVRYRLPLAAVALFMVLQQLVELIYCQYQRQQPGLLFVLGFMIALLVSNYSEARLLVNRDLYWIFFLTLPISMLQQITLTASHTRTVSVPLSLPPNIRDKLTRSRERITQARTLKKRLFERRKITIINQTDGRESPLTDSLGKGLFAADTPENSRHYHKHGGDAMKRKLARRQRRAD